jgi:hypothetical protein
LLFRIPLDVRFGLIDQKVFTKGGDAPVLLKLIPTIVVSRRFREYLDDQVWVQQGVKLVVQEPWLLTDHDYVRIGVTMAGVDTKPQIRRVNAARALAKLVAYLSDDIANDFDMAPPIA